MKSGRIDRPKFRTANTSVFIQRIRIFSSEINNEIFTDMDLLRCVQLREAYLIKTEPTLVGKRPNHSWEKSSIIYIRKTWQCYLRSSKCVVPVATTAVFFQSLSTNSFFQTSAIFNLMPADCLEWNSLEL